MRVGEAAQLVGVATHVLRHWEDEGVVVPERDAANYRNYNGEALHRLRIVLSCQAAGMSLDQIRQILHSDAPGRRRVIAGQRQTIAELRVQLEHTDRFLAHVLDCAHTLVTRCPDCSRYPPG